MRAQSLTVFESLREQNEKNLIDACERGAKIVGTYCIYSPIELVLAAGAYPVSLCGTKQATIPAAEQILPRNLCPLIKSSYGFAVSGSCLYFQNSSLLIAENTCDGKKKMYELMAELKPLHVLEMPQRNDTPEAATYWQAEVVRLKERLEKEFSVTITDDALHQAIALANEERRSLKDLQDACKAVSSPITGSDLLLALFMRNYTLDKKLAIALVDKLTAELRDMAARGEGAVPSDAPRILITGVPTGIGSDKVVKIIEQSGGSVVCFENCTGYKKVIDPVAVDDDPIKAIADKYLKTPCSCMSPNTGRFELVEQLCREFSVDGVIDLTWQACHTYNIESHSLKKYLQSKLSIPFMQLETDYSESDTEQLKVRIEAFLEMIGAHK
jgi:benzoyl-CoA reductase/2-hydroxyglutaryl-CoA dehydratase subunit BcrC/BadD/HgdB